MMKISVTLLMVVVGGWCLPAHLDVDEIQTSNSKPVPIFVKQLPHLQVQVSEAEDGKYGVEVYKGKGSSRTQLPTRAWRLPTDWRAPGRESSRVIHAELISTGEVVLVLYGPKNGLDLIVLPLNTLQFPVDYVTPLPFHSITFPNHTVPWHPTVSSLPENWEWVSPDVESVSLRPRIKPTPEKASVPES